MQGTFKQILQSINNNIISFIVTYITHVNDASQKYMVENFRNHISDEAYSAAFTYAILTESLDVAKSMVEVGSSKISSDAYSSAFTASISASNLGFAQLLLKIDNSRISSEAYDSAFTAAVSIKSLDFVKSLLATDNSRISKETYNNAFKNLAAIRNSFSLAKIIMEKDLVIPSTYTETVQVILMNNPMNRDLLDAILDKNTFDNTLLDGKEIASALAFLARNGESKILKKLAQILDMSSLGTDTEKYMFDSTIDSCFKPSNTLEEIAISEIDFQPLTVAQNYCDTLVLLKNGSILKLKGQDAEIVYSYLLAKTEDGEHKAPSTHCKFVEYLSPGHAFAAINCPSYDYNFGFYPRGNDPKDMLPGDYWAESSMLISTAGVLFPMFYTFASFIAYMTPLGRISHATIGLTAALTLGTSAFLYHQYLEPLALPHCDHKIGHVADESQALRSADKDMHLKVSFIISEQQAAYIKNYVLSVKKDCDNTVFDKCTYNFLTRNCVVFTKEAFNAGGFESNVLEFFAQVQKGMYNFGSFSKFYDTKALFYAFLTADSPFVDVRTHHKDSSLVDAGTHHEDSPLVDAVGVNHTELEEVQ